MEVELSFEAALRKVLEKGDIAESNLAALSDADREEAALFARLWARVDVERRVTVIHRLVDMAESNFRLDFDAFFWHCLTDEDAEVRRAAIEGLWENESPALVRPLVEMLRGDDSPLVRAEAAMALGRFALLAELEELDAAYGELIRDALLEVIHNPRESIEVRRRAIEAIACMSVEGIRRIIDDAYSHPDRRMRLSALFAMGRTADPFWKDIVMGELSDPDPAIRYEAAHAAGELEVREAVPLLTRLIGDADREVQEMAVWALGQIGGEEARRVLQRCCESEDEVLQMAASDALAELELGMTPLDLFVFEVDAPEEDLWDEFDSVEHDEAYR